MVIDAHPAAALVLVDLQLGLCRSPIGAEPNLLAVAVAERGVLSAAAAALEVARRRELHVAHVRLAFDIAYANRTNRTPRFDEHEHMGRFAAGSESVEFCPEVTPRPGEPVFEKGSVSAFASTTLERALRAQGVQTIFLGGVATHLAVESLAREAADRGFNVVVLGDVCAAPSTVIHEHAITQTIPLFAEVVDTHDFEQRLDAETG